MRLKKKKTNKIKMLRTRKYEVPPEEVEKESPVSKEYIN